MTNSLEDRLGRLRVQLDDAADRRQGTTGGAGDDVVVDLAPRRRQQRSALARVLAASLVVAVVVLVLALVLRPSSTPPASSPPQWRRLDRTAIGFAPQTYVGPFTTTPNGTLVALGQQIHGKGQLTAKAWFSRNGSHWQEASVPADSQTPGVVARLRGRTFAASSASTPGISLWSTRNGERWTKIPTTGLEDASQIMLGANTNRVIAVGSRNGTGAAWTSPDGTHWAPANFQDAPPSVLSNPVWIDQQFVALGLTNDNTWSTWSSSDGTLWRLATAATPERLGSLYAPTNSTRVYGIQYETAGGTLADGGSFGGRLFASRDGSAWTEIASFHQRLPVANPDHILRAHGWWILSGNTGTPDGRRRADIWMSRDLRTWSELPRRLQGNTGRGVAVPSGSNSTSVVAAAGADDRSLWLWRP
jgi:hypothetical protein